MPSLLSTSDLVKKYQLNAKKSLGQNFIFDQNFTDKIVKNCGEIENKIILEISVYNEKYKEIILNEHRSKFNLPLYIIMVLIILKYLHYNLGILPLNYYSKLKKFLTNSCYDNNKSEFLVLDV